VRSKLPVISAAAALLAGVGIIAAIWSNGTNTSAACAPYIHAPVPAAAQKELAAYSGRIEHAIEHSGDRTRDEWWNDPVTGSRRQVAFDAHGRIESVFGTTVSANGERSVWVLYPAHNWTVDVHRLPFPRPAAGNAAARIAQANRDKVANRKATIVGRESIDGRQTLHLRETIHLPTPHPPKGFPLPKGFKIPPTPAFTLDTWVDPLTYLTVRSRYGGQSNSSITDESWLPRTQANIAKTKVVIPAGFKHDIPQQGTAIGTFQEISNSCQ
jgi:hypothetical protein